MSFFCNPWCWWFRPWGYLLNFFSFTFFFLIHFGGFQFYNSFRISSEFGMTGTLCGFEGRLLEIAVPIDALDSCERVSGCGVPLARPLFYDRACLSECWRARCRCKATRMLPAIGAGLIPNSLPFSSCLLHPAERSTQGCPPRPRPRRPRPRLPRRRVRRRRPPSPRSPPSQRRRRPRAARARPRRRRLPLRPRPERRRSGHRSHAHQRCFSTPPLPEAMEFLLANGVSSKVFFFPFIFRDSTVFYNFETLQSIAICGFACHWVERRA